MAQRGPRRRNAKLNGLLNHLILFFGVMVVLVPVNFALTPDNPWFAWVMVFWGGPLAIHVAYVMGLFGGAGHSGNGADDRPEGERRNGQ